MKVEFKQEKKIDPTGQDGFNVAYAPAKRAAFKARWYMLLLLVISPVILFAWYFFSEKILIQADGIITSEPITIFARADGLINNIYYKQGEKVAPEMALFEVFSPVKEAEIKHLQMSLELMKKKQAISYQYIKELHNRKVDLYVNATAKNKKFVKEMSDEKYQQIVPLIDRLDLHLTKLKIDDEDIESEIEYQLALQEHESGSAAKIILDLKENLNIARAEKSLLHVSSPAPAIVNEIFVHKGEFVVKNSPLMTLSNRTQPVVHVYVKPKDVEYTTIGNKVTVILPDGREYFGEVRIPSKIADKVPSVLSGPFQSTKAAIKVQIDIDEPIVNFVEGLPVKVRYHHKNILIDIIGRILT